VDTEAQIGHVLNVIILIRKNVATPLQPLAPTKVSSVYQEPTEKLIPVVLIASTMVMNAVYHKLVETKELDVAEDVPDWEILSNVTPVTMILMTAVPHCNELVTPWVSNVWMDTTTQVKQTLTVVTTVPTMLNLVVPNLYPLVEIKTSSVLMTKAT
jgi:hypothetical protein